MTTSRSDDDFPPFDEHEFLEAVRRGMNCLLCDYPQSAAAEVLDNFLANNRHGNVELIDNRLALKGKVDG